MDLAIILPTYNERENIRPLVACLSVALQGLDWEAIFVDDDSPDRTAEVIESLARQNGRIRLIHRVGRRGLASACIEGMLSTQAPVVAVMDADLQHDEGILPQMLQLIRGEGLDLVVGTRNAGGGSMGNFVRGRVLLSKLGEKISHAVCRYDMSDPMSGFFMLRRSLFLEVVHALQGEGFKILVDVLASSRRPLRFGEVGYTFRTRRYGESKLGVGTGVEYLALILNKLMGGHLPPELMQYLFVGSVGLLTHLTILLTLMSWGHFHFVTAQLDTTFLVMVENFFLNNSITFRDRKLRGTRLATGMAKFGCACSLGAWANVVFARALWQADARWFLAGTAGILLGSVWNMSISSLVTWKMPRRSEAVPKLSEDLLTAIEASR